MKTITLDQFLINPQEPIIKAANGEESSRISVPGSSAAIIISEQEYELLKSSAK